MTGKYDSLSCTLSVNAAAGGDDACRFASKLLTMYMNFADEQGWPIRCVDSTPGFNGVGIRSMELEVEGDYVYGTLR
eukprot:3618649-Amphidinium_carterae.1